MQFLSLSFILFLFGSIFAQSFTPESTWVNTQIDRDINLSKAYVKETVTLTIQNIDSKANDEYLYALPNYVFYKISSFTATNIKNSQSLGVAFLDDEVTLVNDQPLVNYLKIKLDKPIAPKQSFKLRLDYEVLDSLEPLPAKIGLSEEQHLLLKTFKLPLSAYVTKSCILSINGVPKGQELTVGDQHEIEHHGSIEDGSIVYRFDDVEPFSISVLPFIYSHNAPLTVVTDLARGVWVSHWSDSLQFEEFYKLTNKAAELISGFSRTEFMLNRRNIRSTHSIAALEVNLNDDAKDIYFTDLVGNVSTSRVLGDKVYLKPRYPVYGGWNYNFTIGWTNTLSHYLNNISGAADEYQLTVPLLQGPSDVVYDNVDLTFYLPEGAQVIEVESQFPYVSKSEGHELSFFDLGKGHTAVTLHFESLTDSLANNEVTVTYKYDTLAMYSLPLNIAKFVGVLLVSYLVLSRFDISLKAK